MKIEINRTENRELVAVLGSAGAGVFFPLDNGGSAYIDVLGKVSINESSLEEILKAVYDRKAVYKGDSITLMF